MTGSERGHKPAAEIRREALTGEKLPDKHEVALDQVFEGYTRINAAFILDLLASIEEAEADETGSGLDRARGASGRPLRRGAPGRSGWGSP